MQLIPTAISRKVAAQALLGKKHSPTILFGAGVVSMVGSTVLACRATLKVEDVLTRIEHDLNISKRIRDIKPDEYSEEERAQDSYVIYVRGMASIVKLYAPAIVFGGVGIACLTKSHKILQDRNMALTAAYIAVDKAFANYRERVIDRYGEDVDRELRYENERVDIIDEQTGKVLSQVQVIEGDHGMYARWFDEENANFNKAPHLNYNWIFLRSQQNWANDMLRARGHLFLNEVYSMLGLSHTSAGSVVGWIYKRENDLGDNFVDFGCWDPETAAPLEFFSTNGRDDAILLDFNVDGPIWELIDESVERNA